MEPIINLWVQLIQIGRLMLHIRNLWFTRITARVRSTFLAPLMLLLARQTWKRFQDWKWVAHQVRHYLPHRYNAFPILRALLCSMRWQTSAEQMFFCLWTQMTVGLQLMQRWTSFFNNYSLKAGSCEWIIPSTSSSALRCSARTHTLSNSTPFSLLPTFLVYLAVWQLFLNGYLPE